MAHPHQHRQPLGIRHSHLCVPQAALQPQQPGAGGADDGIMRTRTYDLLISYDKYYQVRAASGVKKGWDGCKRDAVKVARQLAAASGSQDGLRKQFWQQPREGRGKAPLFVAPPWGTHGGMHSLKDLPALVRPLPLNSPPAPLACPDPPSQVPRFWLVGYDEDRRPLTPDQVSTAGGPGGGPRGGRRACRQGP